MGWNGTTARRSPPEDCVASLKRWAVRDSMGQKLSQSLQDYKVVDPKTFQMVFKEKFGPLLESLGKPSVVVPFMMPKRIAETDAYKQIEDYIGSGPFIFKKDEWKPGEKTVYLKNTKYKPRPEPVSGLAGGKVVTSTASNGCGSRTPRPRSTPCSRARST